MAMLFFLATSLRAELVCGPEWLEGLPGVDGEIRCATTWDPDGAGPAEPVLVVGGFFGMAGDTPASNIALWNGIAWSALGSGTNEGVLTLCVLDGNLVAAGRFTEAGGAAAEHIARWDGAAWSAMGSGLNSFVYATAVFNGELYAGGWLTVNGTRSIARWDGAAWQPVGGGMALSACGNCGTSVEALAVYNNELVAGGYFTQAGGASARYIARWNGSSWNSLGFGTNGQVWDLAVYQGQLIVGGLFTQVATSTSASRIARWNPGAPSAWAPLGGGITGTGTAVYALAVHQDELFVGGFFQNTADGPASHIARWNGSAWAAVDAGLNSTVHALTVFDDDLVAGGHFTGSGPIPSDHWAVWRNIPGPQLTSPATQFLQYGQDATFFVDVTGGFGPLQFAWRKNATELSDDDQITGSQTSALSISSVTLEDQGLYNLVVTDDCRSVTSASATLGVICPGILAVPAPQALIVGQTAHFSVTASGPGTLQYAWRRNNIPLEDNQQISGSQTAELTILQVNKNNIGSYDVVITADCGSRPSVKVNLTVTCPASARPDFDGDCDVDQADLAIFQSCAAGSGVPASPGCPLTRNQKPPVPVADLDLDGDADMNDFGIWQRCFSGPAVPPVAGCSD